MLTFLLKRKIIVGLFIAFIFGLGFYGINNLDKELFPEVTFNQSIIMIETDEMPAEDVEQFVTIPIEQSLEGIDGVTNYESSTTTTGSTLFIDTDSQKSEEINNVIEGEVNRLKSDLHGIRETMVMQATTSAPFELFLDISGADSSEMKSHALDIVKPRLEALPEVREVQISGLEENEIEITPTDNDYGVDQEYLANAITEANHSQTLGTLKKESNNPALRWDTTFKDIDDIKQMPIETEKGTVKLKDIAKVEVTKRTRLLLPGKMGILISCLSKSAG